MHQSGSRKNLTGAMGRRYHCDYCDKTFPDNANNRKKHLQGSHHIRLRKIHYDAFRDAASLLELESAKKPCRRFQQTGACDYGTACKFSHLNADELAKLRQRAEADEQRARTGLSGTLQPPPPPRDSALQDWLQKRMKAHGDLPEPFAYRTMIEKYCTSDSDQYTNLLRSLKPPTLDDLVNCQPTRWG